MKRFRLVWCAILLIMMVVPTAEAAQKRTMQPIAPLMIEYRLVDRMIVVIDTERACMDRNTTVDPAFVDAIIDFIVFYVDKTHHAKEEKFSLPPSLQKTSPQNRKTL